jgi:hypothetical protein
MTTSSWYEPPFLTPSGPDVLETPRDQRTAEEVVDFLKSRFCHAPSPGKKPKELRWVTNYLTFEPSEDSAPKYSDWEACASVFVAVDTLTHHDGVHHSGLEGQSSSTANKLLVLVACALQHRCVAPLPDHTSDRDTLTDLAESFFFSEVRKRSRQARFCSILCDTLSDKDCLLHCGGLILPMG